MLSYLRLVLFLWRNGVFPISKEDRRVWEKWCEGTRNLSSFLEDIANDSGSRTSLRKLAILLLFKPDRLIIRGIPRPRFFRSISLNGFASDLIEEYTAPLLFHLSRCNDPLRFNEYAIEMMGMRNNRKAAEFGMRMFEPTEVVKTNLPLPTIPSQFSGLMSVLGNKLISHNYKAAILERLAKSARASKSLNALLVGTILLYCKRAKRIDVGDQELVRKSVALITNLSLCGNIEINAVFSVFRFLEGEASKTSRLMFLRFIIKNAELVQLRANDLFSQQNFKRAVSLFYEFCDDLGGREGTVFLDLLSRHRCHHNPERGIELAHQFLDQRRSEILKVPETANLPAV